MNTQNTPTYDRANLPKWANKAVAKDRSGTSLCYSSVPVFHSDGCWRGDEYLRIPNTHAPDWGSLPPEKCLIVFED